MIISARINRWHNLKQNNCWKSKTCTKMSSNLIKREDRRQLKWIRADSILCEEILKTFNSSRLTARSTRMASPQTIVPRRSPKSSRMQAHPKCDQPVGEAMRPRICLITLQILWPHSLQIPMEYIPTTRPIKQHLQIYPQQQQDRSPILKTMTRAANQLDHKGHKTWLTKYTALMKNYQYYKQAWTTPSAKV